MVSAFASCGLVGRGVAQTLADLDLDLGLFPETYIGSVNETLMVTIVVGFVGALTLNLNVFDPGDVLPHGRVDVLDTVVGPRRVGRQRDAGDERGHHGDDERRSEQAGGQPGPTGDGRLWALFGLVSWLALSLHLACVGFMVKCRDAFGPIIPLALAPGLGSGGCASTKSGNFISRA